MRRFIILFLLVLLSVSVYCQSKKYEVYAVAFYNLENLFDTVDDPNNPGDDEFTAKGPYNWTQAKYEKKLDNLAKVISRLGRDYCPYGPAAIGVSEVENRKVLEDLVKRPAISDLNLQIIHQDSPDWRGIDVALLYNPNLFQVENHAFFPFKTEDSTYLSRDQLLVSGYLRGESVHLLVNHWPSRYGGKSSLLRESAARVTNSILDSLYNNHNETKAIIMGDLNDDPIDNSCRIVLNAKRDKNDVQPKGLYNPTWLFYEQGIGSLAYQGKWSLFDQMIISKDLIGTDYSTLKFWKFEIFNKDFLIQKEGKHKGYPFRTFSKNTFVNGYSDHFPVITYLIRETK